MSKQHRIPVLGICLILLSTGFVVALAQPFGNPLIVVFGDSEAESVALATLQEELPNSIVVPYDSLAYHFLKTKAIGVAIMVGHGDEAGIYRDKTIVTSEDVAREISRMMARKVFIAACNSRAIAELDESGRSYGFATDVDAELAALETVIRVHVFQNDAKAAWATFDKFVDVLTTKIADEDSIIPLRIIYDDGGGGSPPPAHSLSDAELFSAAVVLGVGCMFALVGIGVSAATAKLGTVISARLGSAASSGLLSTVYAFFCAVGPAGLGSLLACVNAFFGGIISLANMWLTASVDIVNSWIAAMNIVEWLFFLTLTSLEVILLIVTLGSEPAIRLAAGMGVAITNAAIIAISDYLDYNDTPCQSIMEAVSQFYS